MRKTKQWQVTLLALVFLFVTLFTCGFAAMRLRAAVAEDLPEDIGFTFSTYDDLIKENVNIYGTDTETYGSGAGWGGWLKMAKTNAPIDAQAFADSGKGALAFWLYIGDADTLQHYTENIGDNWNIDVCSAETYNDTNKYSFVPATAFKDLRFGWNRIVMPFSAAREKNAIDWHTVRNFRFNQTGCSIPGGKNNIKVGGFTFTTTDLQDIAVLDAPATTFGVKEIKAIVGEALPTEQMTIEELNEEVTAYYPQGWGGYVSILVLDKPYSITVYPSSALSVWVYFKDEADLSRLSSFNIDVSSGAEYSDGHKYSFQLHNVFEMCKQGWNHVILPLESANEKPDMDWSDVQNIRLNVGGSQPAWVATAKYEITETKYTQPTVVGYVPPVDPDLPVKPENPRVPCDADTGLHIDSFEEGWSEGSLCSDTGFFKQGAGAWKLTGLGTGGFSKNFEPTFDLSAYTSLSLRLYVDDAAHFAQMADGQIEMRSANGSDDNEYHWDLKPIAATLQDGWNELTLSFEDAVKSGTVDLEAIKTVRIYFVGLSGDHVTTIFDDLHAHKDPEGTLIEGFDGGWSEMVQTVPGHVLGGSATNFSGEGWSSGGRKKFDDKRTVDIADYDMIGLWVYIGDEVTANAVAGSELELSSSGACDKNEIAFFLPTGLKAGEWNFVSFKIADGKKTGGDIDLTKVNFFGITKTGLPYVTIYLDDLIAYESKYFAEPVTPIEKQTVVNADTVGAFNDTVLDNDEYQEGTGAAMSAAVSQGSFTANFGPVDTGLSLTGEKEIGLALWVYLEDASKVSALSVSLASEASGFELVWNVTVSGLQTGWNWLTFRATQAERRGGVIDLTKVCRVTVSFSGVQDSPIKLGFDCVRLVNVNAEGAFDQVVDRRELDPIESFRLDNAEAAWEGSDYTETNKKEGFGAVRLAGTHAEASKQIAPGKTDLLVTRPRANNELGLTLWIYVNDPVKVTNFAFRIGSGEDAYAEWALGGLQTGWNWVTLRASASTVTGTVDPDALTHLKAIADGEDFEILLDRITLVNYTVAETLAEPADEGQSRNYLQEKIIIDCDVIDTFHFPGNRLDKEDFRQGSACVYTSGAGYQLYATDLDIGKTDLTKDTIAIGFWIWVQSAELLRAEGVNGQVELTSSNQYDVHEIAWDIQKFIPALQDGWNWVALRGTDAGVSGDGGPDFNALNYFRIHINGVADSVMKLDRVTIGYVGNETLFAEPDWENERVDSGVFKGPNGNMAQNDTYLGVDFSEAEGYTKTEKETYEETVSGCDSVLTAGAGSIAALGAVLSAAGAILFLRKKKA